MVRRAITHGLQLSLPNNFRWQTLLVGCHSGKGRARGGMVGTDSLRRVAMDHTEGKTHRN